jgi:hypothetical protein
LGLIWFWVGEGMTKFDAADALDYRINASVGKIFKKSQQIRKNEFFGSVLVFVLVWQVFRNYFETLANPNKIHFHTVNTIVL